MSWRDLMGAIAAEKHTQNSQNCTGRQGYEKIDRKEELGWRNLMGASAPEKYTQNSQNHTGWQGYKGIDRKEELGTVGVEGNCCTVTDEDSSTHLEAGLDLVQDGPDVAGPAHTGAVLPAVQGEEELVSEPQVQEAGGFLYNYTSDHAIRISKARTLVLDIETTSLSPFSNQVGSVKWVGGHGYHRPRNHQRSAANGDRASFSDLDSYYLDWYPACQVDTTRRVRVITIRLVEDGWTGAWDLDHLLPEERKQLAHDVLAGKIVVGHNLSFDLAWLSHLTDASPARVLDSMLITRCHCHRGRLLVHQRAALGDEVSKALVKATGRKGVGVTLAECAAAFRLTAPNKNYQGPENWCVSELSPGHYDYCVGDVDLPLRVIRCAVGLEADASLDMILASLKSRVYEAVFEPALSILGVMHHRGIPVSVETIDSLTTKLKGEAIEHAKAAIGTAPVILEPATGDLERGAETDAVRQALRAYLQCQGKDLPKTETGKPSLSKEALTKARLSEDPVIKRFINVKAAVKRIQMLEDWRAKTDDNGRVHPLISISTIAGRTSSQVPNSQNLPRDPEWRAIVKARPGHVIISADYSHIELRIASALAARAVKEIEQTLAGHGCKVEPWIRRALEDARGCVKFTKAPPDAVEYTLGSGSYEWRRVQSNLLTRAYYGVLTRGQVMAQVFRSGIDPHLATAVTMAARAGRVDLKGLSEIEFLKTEDQSILKKKLAAERQAGKTANFGLLYGQSASGMDGDGGLFGYGVVAYGLNWSKEEAAMARMQWLEMYPELHTWQLWTRHAYASPRKKMMFIGYDGRATDEATLWKVATLIGREMVATTFREALNWQDQGSGADLILMVLSRLPEPVASCLIDVVHDELLFEAPADQAEHIKRQAVETMEAVGTEMLGPGNIPVEVEAVKGAVWKH